VVGVLEPSVPYPAQIEIIANVVTSPHHLGATMVTGLAARGGRALRRVDPRAVGPVRDRQATLAPGHRAGRPLRVHAVAIARQRSAGMRSACDAAGTLLEEPGAGRIDAIASAASALSCLRSGAHRPEP
jgi:hypothetical protein